MVHTTGPHRAVGARRPAPLRRSGATGAADADRGSGFQRGGAASVLPAPRARTRSRTPTRHRRDGCGDAASSSGRPRGRWPRRNERPAPAARPGRGGRPSAFDARVVLVPAGRRLGRSPRLARTGRWAARDAGRPRAPPRVAPRRSAPERDAPTTGRRTMPPTDARRPGGAAGRSAVSGRSERGARSRGGPHPGGCAAASSAPAPLTRRCRSPCPVPRSPPDRASGSWPPPGPANAPGSWRWRWGR